MAAMPLLPAIRFCQVVSTSPPSGVTNPRPVTTTRRIISLRQCPQNKRPPDCVREAVRAVIQSIASGSKRTRSALVLIDIFDRVADGRDLFRGIVRNLDAELFLEGHDQLDDVQAVRTEVIDEARVLGDLVGLDAEMFDDDLLHPIGSLAHVTLPPLAFVLP